MPQPNDREIQTKILLQEMMHYHGLKRFKELLQQTYYSAAEDTEDINKEISEAYQSEASKMGED